MGQRNFIDFDSIFKEKERQPIYARLKGQDFVFPAAMPAKMFLRLQRMEEKSKQEGRSMEDEVTTDELLTLFSDILGHENFQRLLDLEVSFDELNAVLAKLMSVYTNGAALEDGGEDAKKEVAATPTATVKELRL